MVSNKMIEAYADENNCGDTAKEHTQLIINAAWTTFDKDDESTWPETEYAPSGQFWTLDDGKQLFDSRWEASIKCFWHDRNKETIRYADPADLMYKDIK